MRILALVPFYRGLVFVVVGKEQRLIGYGMKCGVTENKQEWFLQRAMSLMQYYRPAVIVVEDWTTEEYRRTVWVQELLQELWKLATREKIHIRRISRSVIQGTFSAAEKTATKQQVVHCLVSLYPELAHKQPPVRKPWMGEDPRMYVFDALALALVFYTDTQEGRGSRTGRARRAVR